MRLSFITAAPMALLAESAQAQPVPSARCAPQVEATAAVAPATVARLAAALTSGGFAGQCPRVRLDVVNARLVMAVVLDDGRQVARVLATPHDALPTLVALTATLAIPAAPEGVESSQAPPEAPAVEAPIVAAPAVSAPVATAPVVVTPAAPVGRAWSLRLGASLGAERRNTFSPQAVLDLDLVLRRWVFGVSASFARSSRAITESASASARWRWGAGRWQVEVGPSAGWVQVFNATRDVRYGMRFGAVGAVSLRLSAALSLFARVEGGVEVTARHDAQTDEVSRATGGFYSNTAGLRWEFLR